MSSVVFVLVAIFFLDALNPGYVAQMSSNLLGFALSWAAVFDLLHVFNSKK